MVAWTAVCFRSINVLALLEHGLHIYSSNNSRSRNGTQERQQHLDVSNKSFVPFERTNSYTKLFRITAYVLKFLSKLHLSLFQKNADRFANKNNVFTQFDIISDITTRDWKAAEHIILREHYRENSDQLQSRAVQQFHVKQTDDVLYRSMSRMGNARIPAIAKNPILLIPHHPLTHMLVTHYHLRLHHAACAICKRHQGSHYAYPTMPDLPSERVNQSRPFENTGLDYFGPLYIRSLDNQNQKVWVCLFTCMTTRAIHLELVPDNSATQFLLAFRRFISRRGTPNIIMSDNAPTFKLGKEVLINELQHVAENKVIKDFSTATGFEWKFITPLSPWKGGFYED